MKSYELLEVRANDIRGPRLLPPLDAHHSVITIPMDEINDYWWNVVEKGLVLKEMFGLICWPTNEPTLRSHRRGTTF